MTFVHRLTLKQGRHVQNAWFDRGSQNVARPQLFGLILVQPIRCVLQLVFQHSQVLRYQIRHRVPVVGSFE